MSYLLQTESTEYALIKFLGKGATCKCYLGYEISSSNSKTPKVFAIKIFTPKFYKYYSNEVNFLSKLSSNENIIKLYNHGEGYISPLKEKENTNLDINKIEDESQKVNGKVYFEIMKYAINGELKDYVQGTETRIPEKISAKIFLTLVLIVKDLHKNNISHCDLKPENVLLGDNFRILLSDFGFSQTFNGDKGDYILHSFAGSPIYSAPETRKAYTKGFDAIKNDIFSLGVLLFVITIGRFPFHMTSFSDEKYRYIIKKNYEGFWDYFNNIEISDEFKDLINNLINITPSQRLEIGQILEHPWLKKYINGQSLDSHNFVDEEVIKELSSRKG